MQGSQIVQDPEAPAVGGGDQVVIFDGQVVDGYGG